MTDEVSYEGTLREYLSGELRVLNAYLPCEQRSLANLLAEEYPGVACNDGTSHLFKRKELEYLASLLDSDEQAALSLPILIEVKPGQSEIAVICRGEVEIKLISRILNMPITPQHRRIVIYKPQLALIRQQLKTTTQYLFSAKLSG